jgi:hypothetical protein
MVLYYQDQLTFLGDGFDDQSHLPPHWIGIASLLVLSGVGCVWVASRKRALDSATLE